MKLRWILLTAVMLCLLTGCAGDPDAPTGYVTASGEAADYMFFVPDDWTVDMTTGATGAYCSAEDPSSVSVMSWELDAPDTTVEEWWKDNLADIEMVFQNVAVEAEENITLDQVHGKKYVYSAQLGEYSYRILQAAAVRNGYVYLVTYTSLADTYDSHLEEVNAMLGFFTFR